MRLAAVKFAVPALADFALQVDLRAPAPFFRRHAHRATVHLELPVAAQALHQGTQEQSNGPAAVQICLDRREMEAVMTKMAPRGVSESVFLRNSDAPAQVMLSVIANLLVKDGRCWLDPRIRYE